MCVSCGCMDMWLVFLMLILLTRFSQRGSLMSGGGQWVDHVPRGCRRLVSISRRWGWARCLPGGRPDGGPWSTDGKWTQQCAAPAHAPICDPTWIPRTGELDSKREHWIPHLGALDSTYGGTGFHIWGHRIPHTGPMDSTFGDIGFHIRGHRIPIEVGCTSWI